MRPTAAAPRLALLVTLGLLPVASAAAAPATHERPAPATASARAAGDTRVLAISIDGLNPRALKKLGPHGAPNFTRLIDEGAATLNARSQVEQTVTLPNHTSMLTGRRINAKQGGHGVVWNTDIAGSTVQKAAGEPVESIFTDVAEAGGSTALFATKVKFGIYQRSWGADIDRFVADEKVPRLVRAVRADLATAERDFTFLHISLPDVAGHADGFMSAAYFAAVARTDKLLGKVLSTIDATPALEDHLVVLLTADHGGIGANHSDRTKLQNYRIPFVAWGHGVSKGVDLYDINPSYADPGRTRPGYGGTQPIRNGMIADLSADLLGLPAVDGSLEDADQSLTVSSSIS